MQLPNLGLYALVILLAKATAMQVHSQPTDAAMSKPAKAYSTAGFTSDERAIVKVAENFLEGIGARNKTLMLDQVLPSGGATLLRNEVPIFTNLTGLIDRIPFDLPQSMEERISGQPVVRVDKDIAMLWTPYEFLIAGVIDHVGTDIWSFAKQNGRWLISGVADNSRAPDCDDGHAAGAQD
ncbi:hypothetical protein BDZ94DRAFT_1310643 [Collybia nuda]|uniref:Nuclear transport factor 2 family protein n=1 Tax=Collybia nuda TaxID=64659 RepID=A0A9P5Y317_9AGAR|nr:hypothetical protein BDZ94DRAFT_1310643 [Collybia nuda]